MRAPLVAVVLVAAAFAGCLGGAEQVEPAKVDPIEPPPVDPIDNATGPAFTVETIEGRVPLSVGTPVASASPTGNEEFVKTTVAPPNHTGIVVELSWTAKAGSESLQLTVEDFAKDPALDAPLGSADGTSPLKVVLTPEQFAGGKLRMRVFASSKGSVAQDQPFTMYVSMFSTEAPGEGYSAVPPASS
ncbi:MAG TPA: hypothetical protein VI997_12430 [Candidatus Thermoplasmatota archaeon]|nr:hypothetical protein [Candidatus Thermoplasmatota archaeon]